MRARLTNRHTLHLDRAGTAIGQVTPQDPQLTPGTWGSWLDDMGSLVPNSQFQLGFGDFNEAFRREAYDRSVALLNQIGGADGLIQFENLQWV